MDRATSNARSLAALLGGTVYGKHQDATGTYPGGCRRVSIADLEAHFRGETAIAISCADGESARILAWDIDERFDERAVCLAAVLARHDLHRYAIATEGSSAGRGKIVIFCEPAPQASARDKALDILDQAREESTWDIETRGKVESRPLDATGG